VLFSSIIFGSGIGVDPFSQELEEMVRLINLYCPYEDIMGFWEGYFVEDMLRCLKPIF
jgi:hypothetical protein